MRMEWGHWISQRRWDFFEYQVKKNPSQQLCDTVAELEAGMESREDRRALKRVLYLLKQIGFEPTPKHKPEELVHWSKKPLSPRRWVRGFMSAANMHGAQHLYYGYPKGSSWNLLVFQNGEFMRNYHHSLEKGPLCCVQHAIFNIAEISLEHGQVIHEVHADYVFDRIAKAVLRGDAQGDECEPIPADAMRWIEESTPMRHPALDLPLRSVTETDCRTLWLAYPDSARWRIWIGSHHEVWAKVHAIRWDPDWSEEEKTERSVDLLLRERRSILDEHTISNHALRMRDMAYLLALQDNVDSEKFAAIALEIESKGPASSYLAACLEQTAKELPQLMEKDELEDDSYAWAA